MIPRSAAVLLATLGLLGSTPSALQTGPVDETRPSARPQLEVPGRLDLPLDIVVFGEDPGELNQMGAAMEVVGNYLFIAAPGDGAGRVDVWYRAPLGYVFVQRLSIPAPIAGVDAHFGRALAGDGDVLAVGTRTGQESGRVAVFRRAENGLYFFESILEPAGGHAPLSFFGERLAVIDDELIAVAARGALRVHLFEAAPDGSFPATSSAVLDAVNTGAVPQASWQNGFGATVALHRTNAGETSVLVGMQDACFYQLHGDPAPDETTPDASGATAARTGGVAVLRKTAGAWSLDHRLIPDWSRMKDFGFEVAVDGPHVAVGAIYSQVFSNGHDAGTASVYRWNGARFELVKTIWPSIPYPNAWFGYSIALHGNHVLVGQPFLWGGPQGLVEVFRITTDDLVSQGLFAAPDGNPAGDAGSLGDGFGREIVCNSFGEVIVGAPFSAPESGSSPQYAGGAVYVYR